jgi:multidrug efflux pump subunit AcrB
MLAPASQTFDIAHLIQVALTPIFLISAIGVILNVLASRLARIVDRARKLEEALGVPTARSGPPDVNSQLQVLSRRARYINAGITLITVSALLIALVVVMLFMNAFLRWDLSEFIAIMFILSMLSLAAALLSFLIEVRIANRFLSIGIISAQSARDE